MHVCHSGLEYGVKCLFGAYTNIWSLLARGKHSIHLKMSAIVAVDLTLFTHTKSDTIVPI